MAFATVIAVGTVPLIVPMILIRQTRKFKLDEALGHLMQDAWEGDGSPRVLDCQPPEADRLPELV